MITSFPLCAERKFAGGFHSDEWRRNQITFTPCERTTSENYLFLLPMILSGRARLLNSGVLRSQLAGLERSLTAGHEKVTHAAVASAHDDVATAVAGALVAAGHGYGFDPRYQGFCDGDDAKVSATRTSSNYAIKQMRLSILSGGRMGTPGFGKW